MKNQDPNFKRESSQQISTVKADGTRSVSIQQFFFILAWRMLFFPLLFSTWKLLSWFGFKKAQDSFAERKKKSSEKSNSFNSPRQMTVWIHASSGEIESARPILAELAKDKPNIRLLVTAFSPSSLKLLHRSPEIDQFSFIPWDNPIEVRRFLKKEKPNVVLFSRGDLWPELLYQLKKEKIPTCLFAFYPRGIFKPLLGFLDAIFVVNKTSFDFLKAHDLPAEIARDPRFETTWQRLANSKLPKRPWPEKTLVMGSIWPEDQRAWQNALQVWFAAGGKVIWTSHDWANALNAFPNLSVKKWSEEKNKLASDWKDFNVLWVDEVGVLAELYQWGDLATVGGSFRKRVHSVMEPLAAGLHVLVGPHCTNSPESLEFAEVICPSLNTAVKIVSASGELETHIQQWLKKFEENQAMVSKDRAFIQQQIQATQGGSKVVAGWVRQQLEASAENNNIQKV